MQNTFDTVEQYNEAKKMHDENHAAVMEYCRANKTNGIPCIISEKFPYAKEVNNDLRSKIEVWEFLHDKPDTYFLYINEEKREATTWTGLYLGKVSLGQSYRSVFGDTRVPINVYGVNGVKYHGIYYKSAGSYARIKAFKKQN